MVSMTFRPVRCGQSDCRFRPDLLSCATIEPATMNTWRYVQNGQPSEPVDIATLQALLAKGTLLNGEPQGRWTFYRADGSVERVAIGSQVGRR